MTTRIAAALCALLTMAAVHAGPPLICVAFECDAESLPMGANDLQIKKSYKIASLEKDVLAYLDQADSVIERMETIRRAALYVNRNRKTADGLFTALTRRALNAEASGAESEYADALFDAGYFAATVANLRIKFDGDPGVDRGIAGYAWITRAIELSGDEPSMHFAAALAAHPAIRDSRRDLFEAHIALAAEGVNEDPVLAKNLTAHLDHFGESLDRIVTRAEARRERDSG